MHVMVTYSAATEQLLIVYALPLALHDAIAGVPRGPKFVPVRLNTPPPLVGNEPPATDTAVMVGAANATRSATLVMPDCKATETFGVKEVPTFGSTMHVIVVWAVVTEQLRTPRDPKVPDPVSDTLTVLLAVAGPKLVPLISTKEPLLASRKLRVPAWLTANMESNVGRA
jgi:hypothetical protein